MCVDAIETVAIEFAITLNDDLKKVNVMSELQQCGLSKIIWIYSAGRRLTMQAVATG